MRVSESCASTVAGSIAASWLEETCHIRQRVLHARQEGLLRTVINEPRNGVELRIHRMDQEWVWIASWGFFDLQDGNAGHWLRSGDIDVATPAQYNRVAVVPGVQNPKWNWRLSALPSFEVVTIPVWTSTKLICAVSNCNR